MHKFSIITTLFSGILLVIFSCKHQPEDFTTQAGSAGPNAAAVCFESDVLPLFQSYCAKSGCHDAISHQGDYVLDTYENIVRQGIIPGNATNSKMYQVLFENGSDKMPPTPNADLSTTQKSLIGRWINEGARKTTACSIACDTTQFKFGTNISVILNTYCTSCHGGATPSANINLTVWSGAAGSHPRQAGRRSFT